MTVRLAPVLAGAFAASFVASAHAGVINLSAPVGGANLYAIHNFTGVSSDVQGAVVAGGNVNLTNYSINGSNQDAFGSNGYALVAGGNLNVFIGSVGNGKAYVGGTTSQVLATSLTTSSTDPVDFTAAAAYYKTLANSLAGLGATGTVADIGSAVDVTGSGAGNVDVFNVSAAAFGNASSWTLDQLVPGETLIFNVSGTSGSFDNGGLSFAPLSGYNVLFNFYQATSLNVNGVIGSVLAPYATVTSGGGAVSGNVIVDTWSSTTQVNASHFFTPIEYAAFGAGTAATTTATTTTATTTATAATQASATPSANVPEPGTISLMGAGIALMFGLLSPWKAFRNPKHNQALGQAAQ